MGSANQRIAMSTFPPIVEIPGDLASGLLFLCDHASNALPPEYGDLGLPAEAFSRHIAYDIGAAPLTRAFAAATGAPAIMTTWSRLLLDPNRGRDDPTLVMRLSDGQVVPGNHPITEQEIARRVERFLLPYDDAIAAILDRFAAARIVPVVISTHSFTPIWRGRARHLHVAMLHDADARLARPLIRWLSEDPTLVVGDNEPYDGALAGDTLYRHATRRGLPNVILEVRQDLIADEGGVRAWAERLAPLLKRLAADPELRRVEYHGSRTGPVPPWTGR
jgi:predicted N-formylglutamate amidohydrolase